ncbi:MAG: radical SAM protein [Candidatus Omnitrophota bacterium]|jgi:MoaA/NifB/PqqE/SkfB family radical SAM enzyme
MENKPDFKRLKEYNYKLASDALSSGRPFLKSMPVDINIQTTLKCNLRCIMCQRETVPRENLTGNMPLSLFKRIAQESFPFADNVSFTVIGEPLLTDNIFEMLDILKEYQVGLELVTNANLLDNDKLILKMLDLLNVISVSLDAASKETYEAIRRGGDFEKVISNLRRFSQLRKKTKNDCLFSISFLGMERNIRELPRVIDLAKDIGAQQVNLSDLLVFREEMKEESLMYHKEMEARYISEAIDVALRSGINLTLPPAQTDFFKYNFSYLFEKLIATLHGIKNKILFYNLPSNKRCRYLWAKVYIDERANVYPCCAPRKPLMGNLYEQTLKEIWNNSLYLKMREGFLTEKPFDCCQDCNLNPIKFNVVEEKKFIKI